MPIHILYVYTAVYAGFSEMKNKINEINKKLKLKSYIPIYVHHIICNNMYNNIWNILLNKKNLTYILWISVIIIIYSIFIENRINVN